VDSGEERCARQWRGNKKKREMLVPTGIRGAQFSLFLGTNKGGLGGIKIGSYLGELLESIFLIISLNFNLRSFLGALGDALSATQ
jgi:hypothetical protein